MAIAYDLNDLIKACGEINRGVVLGKAERSARDDFGLLTKKAVLDFIYNDGLEKPQHINTKRWEQNPDTDLILIDAYSFYSGPKHGYLAFFHSPKTGKWLIKSFKLNRDAEPRNYLLADKLLALKELMEAKEEK